MGEIDTEYRKGGRQLIVRTTTENDLRTEDGACMLVFLTALETLRLESSACHLSTSINNIIDHLSVSRSI